LRKISRSWRLEGSLEHLKDVISRIQVIIASHVRRNDNNVVDIIANEGIS